MQIENTIFMTKAAESPVLLTENGTNVASVKISGADSPAPDNPGISPLHQCSNSNPGSRHLVYVRRKAEAESGRTPGCDDQGDRTGVGKHWLVTSQQKDELNEPANIMTEASSTSRDSLDICLTTKPSVLSSLPRFSNNTTPSNTTRNITSINSSDGCELMDIKLLHDRYFRLQNFLKELDVSNQDDYIQMLRSLSSVELSRHAVELEKRCIQLSLEEGKELERVQVLNVLGRYLKNSWPTSPSKTRPTK